MTPDKKHVEEMPLGEEARVMFDQLRSTGGNGDFEHYVLGALSKVAVGSEQRRPFPELEARVRTHIEELRALIALKAKLIEAFKEKPKT